MDEKLTQYFRRHDLSAYSFRERLLIKLADIVFYSVISLFGSTYRIETIGEENLDSLPNDTPVLYAAWHEHIFSGSYVMRGRHLVTLVSQSFDGEYLARFVSRFDYGSIRGSSTRGGLKALVAMSRAVEDGLSALITVDGPKGPAQIAKGGICTLAKKTGAPIVPIAIEPNRFWRIGSWDRMRIGKPFARIRHYYGTPILIGPSDDVDAKLAEVQAALDELNQAGESWRQSLKSSH